MTGLLRRDSSNTDLECLFFMLIPSNRPSCPKDLVPSDSVASFFFYDRPGVCPGLSWFPLVCGGPPVPLVDRPVSDGSDSIKECVSYRGRVWRGPSGSPVSSRSGPARQRGSWVLSMSVQNRFRPSGRGSGMGRPLKGVKGVRVLRKGWRRRRGGECEGGRRVAWRRRGW